jgi:hypothetical protein
MNLEIRDELWIKLLAPQTWIYVVKDTIETKISCPNTKSKTISLNRTGLIEIPSKSILITNNTILHPTMEIESQIVSSFVFSIDDLNQPIAYQKTKNLIRLMVKTVKFKERAVYSDLSAKLSKFSEIKLIDMENHPDPNPWEIFDSFQTTYNLLSEHSH